MKLSNVDSGKEFNWGLTSKDYAKYRDIYPAELYTRLQELGVAADGTSWLDLGTGTGILPQNLYNENAVVTAVDISAEQIEQAKNNAKINYQSINYIVAPAESTGLPDNNFDCITAAQCFAYFDREIMKKEIKRLLKHGGKFIKIYLDWCLDDEITQKSINLVKEFNSKWNAEVGFSDMYDDLFDGRITEEYLCEIPFTRESWHGRMCACRGTLASMSREQFAKWSEAHQTMINKYPENFSIKHKLFITYFEL